MNYKTIILPIIIPDPYSRYTILTANLWRVGVVLDGGAYVKIQAKYLYYQESSKLRRINLLTSTFLTNTMLRSVVNLFVNFQVLF